MEQREQKRAQQRAKALKKQDQNIQDAINEFNNKMFHCQEVANDREKYLKGQEVEAFEKLLDATEKAASSTGEKDKKFAKQLQEMKDETRNYRNSKLDTYT